MAKTEKYIYGIIDSDAEEPFGPCGITACEMVYTISFHDISAVVSDSEIVDYTCMRKDTLARLLLRHQKTIEKIMGLEHPVIPMRLGTFVSDKTEVKDILTKGYSLTKEIFGKIKDKIEIDVAAAWSDFNSVLKEAAEEQEIKEIKERLLADPKGVTVDEQMKVGLMVKKALGQKREIIASQIHSALEAVSQEFKEHELMDDKMVINKAFLINRAKQKDFYKRVEELNTKFDEKLNFRCVGPLPPYSFYTLEIKRMGFEELDQARKRLQLNDTATKDEIKKAHQELAFSLHPDKNPFTPGIERRFDEANKAYKILLEYCAAVEQTGQRDGYSFNEEKFKKNNILVKVKE